MRPVKPLVVLGGPIHPDGMKQLEAEARVVVTDAQTEAGMIAAAREAEGILFRSKPDCTRTRPVRHRLGTAQRASRTL